MHRKISATTCLLAAACLCAVGCATPWSKADKIDDISYSHPAERMGTSQPSTTATEFDDKGELSNEEALAGVLDELQEIGGIDPEAQQQLMADLRETKPEHYALVVDQFRTALAYRQQLEKRDELAEQERELAMQSNSGNGSSRAAKQTAEQVVRDQIQAVASSEPLQVTTHSLHAIRSLPVPPKSHSQSMPQAKSLAPIVSDQQTTELTNKGLPPVNAQVQSASYTALGSPPTANAHGWEAQLKSAIAQLESEVSPEPRSVEEVHEHLRLRTLQLLAGDQEAALQSIPGASPAQQDYWAKQLFAISTFLDQETHKDGKARAAAALVHLDAARGQLAELATLQVRNMTFAERVDGFGEYKTAESTLFKPGGSVTLYAEVANYRSDSTEEGYRTVLTTSYQVVDKAGQRVDGGQFPDVEDICQNRRRDFHMQYTIPLPMRIYAGHYEMQLIITDGLSNKIGQASIPFEIE
ncbi:hypothetical protein [Adhaeretor mobilis]|uniref:Lipoprotein n=1 Tax=Adhaeretor mobilis TaxID=1930276 RepID=A0A517N0B6_9BACT|nr:hypothetical protein [Adhaeretor mobilis]QDT00579.1 hypothetical protein HG15A2_39170 [Adhaeretor mobilis]